MILGLNAVFHESSACVFGPQGLISLVEEERYSRVRHAKIAGIGNTDRLPWESIDRALSAANVSMPQIACVAYSFDPDARFAAAGRVPDDPDIPAGDYGSPAGERRLRDQVFATGRLLAATDRVAGTGAEA